MIRLYLDEYDFELVYESASCIRIPHLARLDPPQFLTKSAHLLPSEALPHLKAQCSSTHFYHRFWLIKKCKMQVYLYEFICTRADELHISYPVVYYL